MKFLKKIGSFIMERLEKDGQNMQNVRFYI